MQQPVRSAFFSNPAEEKALEEDNHVFWDALLGHIDVDLRERRVHTVLDVGCHHGGLLLRLTSRFNPTRVIGIEPIATARRISEQRFKDAGLDARVLDVTEWDVISKTSVDLIVCHEVLYLLPSLDEIMNLFSRVLRSGAAAYAVLGCHAENPVWQQWSRLMEEEGHKVFTHSPLDVMAAASRAGMAPSVQPLRRDGWIAYDPAMARFKFPDATTMLDHHYRHKLLFRFVR